MVKVCRECQECKNIFWIPEEDNKPTEKFTCALCNDDEIVVEWDLKNNHFVKE